MSPRIRARSSNDFVIPKLGVHVRLDKTSDWRPVKIEFNIQQVFDIVWNHYWLHFPAMRPRNLNVMKCVVKWDTTNIIDDGSSFKIFEGEAENLVLVAIDVMTRPRLQLLSTLLHVQIHIFLKIESKGSIKIHAHDETFKMIMRYLNDKLKTQITTGHKFFFAPDEAEHENCCYQCDGVCRNLEPFFGTIYSKTIPVDTHSTWMWKHEVACGGNYFKVFPMHRINRETGTKETRYVRHVRDTDPKPCEPVPARVNTRTTIQIREIVDMTDENEPVKVQNNCETIDVDTREHNQEEFVYGYYCLARAFIDFNSHKCPFCQALLKASYMLDPHINVCPGKLPSDRVASSVPVIIV